MIQQIVYYSISEEKNSDTTVAEILEQSRKNNSLKDITGCLLFHNNVFLQLLEGKKNDIKNLFKVIKKDKRHSNVTLIIEENISDRMFPGWSMAFQGLDTNKANLKKFIESVDFFSNNIPKKTEAIDLFWRMAKQIVVK